ncbi:MAG: tetratricopeptide repeat protein [Desulfurivibrionaceae bacterium]
MKIGRLLLFWIITVSVAGLTLNGCAPKRIRPASPAVPSVADGVGEDRERTPGSGGEGLTDFEFASKPPGSADQRGPGGSAVRTERILVLPSVPFVDRRMTIYADKLSSWEALARQLEEVDLEERMPERWHECLASVEEMFRDYSVLMEALLVQDHPAVKSEQIVVDPWLLYQKDISFLEGGCDQVFVAGASLVGGWDNFLSTDDNEIQEDEALVARSVAEGRYEEAIEAFEELIDSRPERAVGAHTSKMYGLALLRTGKFDLAAEVLATTLENMLPSYERRELRRLVADLNLASGQLAKARGHYRILAEHFESRGGDDRWVAGQLALIGEMNVNAREFPLYREVLKGYISFDGRNIPGRIRQVVERMGEDYQESPLTDQARQMLMGMEDSIREWVAGRLDQIDNLRADHNYVEARAALEKLLSDDLPAPVHGMVQRSMDNLLQAEAAYRQEQQVMMAETFSAQWDKAVWLLEAKRYDEAIVTFRNLLNTEYDVPARVNIERAAEDAAVEMRRRSATVFVKARKENDEARKREFLRESWQLLYDITVKYPEVSLIDKVRQNLEIIEKHIETFDPRMLGELKTDEQLDSEEPDRKLFDWLS